MATITTEYGKLSSNKTRTVYLRIRSGKTEKRINTQVKVLESEISPRTKKIIYHYQGKPGSRSQLARDTFILSFCLMGMNSVDLFSATNYKNGFIKYNRTKTKDRRNDEAYIEVKVHPFIKPLMKKYAGTKTVFNFCSRYNDYEGFNKNLNIGLKTVGKAVGINDLEFYQARHTFATLSRNLMKFSKGDVDEALNHVGSFEVADIYIAKDFSIINDNNFKLIKRVFKKELACVYRFFDGAA